MSTSVTIKVMLSDGKYQERLEVTAKDLPTATKIAKRLAKAEFPGYTIQNMAQR